MEPAVFQPLISQNYSSDQAGSALHGCRGHTTQPRGQPANYRPLRPPSLSPLGRWGRWSSRGRKPGRKQEENIDFNIERSTVSVSYAPFSFSVLWREKEYEALVCNILITPFPALRQRKKLRPMGPELCQCMWIYISACHWLYMRGLCQCLLSFLCLKDLV